MIRKTLREGGTQRSPNHASSCGELPSPASTRATNSDDEPQLVPVAGSASLLGNGSGVGGNKSSPVIDTSVPPEGEDAVSEVPGSSTFVEPVVATE